MILVKNYQSQVLDYKQNLIQNSDSFLENGNFQIIKYLNYPYFFFNTQMAPIHQSSWLEPSFVLENQIKCSKNQEIVELQQNSMKKQQQASISSTISSAFLKRNLVQNQVVKNEKNENIFQKQKAKKKREIDSFTEKRNIIPNNINHILAFIQRKSKSEPTVNRIINRFGTKAFTSKRFYCYQTFLKQKIHIHVNVETLDLITNHLDLSQEIFTVQQQLFYNRVCRTLICFYIRELAKLKILSSKRVKLTSKIDHLQAQRTLFEYMSSKNH